MISADHTIKKDIERLAQVCAFLDSTNIEYYTVSAKQYLSRFADASDASLADSPLLVRSTFLGRTEYTPIEQYSFLLKKYNQVIDQTNIYVKPEQYAEISKNWH